MEDPEEQDADKASDRAGEQAMEKANEKESQKSEVIDHHIEEASVENEDHDQKSVSEDGEHQVNSLV